MQPSDNPTRYDGGPLHPAMVEYKPVFGSVVLDIDGDTADVVFLDHGGPLGLTADYVVTDTYRLVK